MSSDSFRRRVELLRDAWAERREFQGLASVHDFESQLGLLVAIHSWAEDAAADVLAVYAGSLNIRVSPRPGLAGTDSEFSVTLADNYTITFSLVERRRLGGGRWFISVSVGAGGPGGAIVAAGPERRNGQWTRSRLEDILLSALGGYERAASEGGKASTSTELRATGA